ncbi:MAG: UDP-N-acetylmuramoyl-tripeptide--D-alanyl-D-alanine ligase [Clostridia bacterium]|nr:UDP-N-acetylmuramoyl-tripeptide--D-alanyl-D-alanine ligase [Clostridia bacterium]
MLPTNAQYFSELLSKNQISIYFIIAVLNAALIFMASFKFLLSIQQSGYKTRRYFKWLNSRETPYRSRLMLLTLMGFLFSLVLSTCFAPIFGGQISSYVGFVSYILFTIVYINTEASVNVKIPLKKTKRMVRLSITYVIVLIAITFGLVVLVNYITFVIGDRMTAILRYSLLCACPVLIPYLLLIAHIINLPIEKAIARYYVNKAKEKLAKLDVKRIAITGSFGKTTVKEILTTILSQKYRVLQTPESYNTPMGIAVTVKGLDSTHDIFLAEMGARAKGDIKTLCKMVKPDFGILTGVNTQHLETFATIENIKNTKYELFDYLEEKGGVGIFSVDNENSKELSNKFKGEKICAGLCGEDAFATDVKISSIGTEFMLNVKGEEPVLCHTVLLGKHNISNICLAAAMAKKIGMSAKEISVGINRIKSIGHRLELMPNNKNIVIIDDSYNANVDGVYAAMDVLDTFSGRKIVLTPGLVELGKMEDVANLEMGKVLAEHADKVIIIGKHNAVMLINGLIEGGMPRENIIFAKNLKKGNQALNEILKEGDVVLFENDLPDNYN